MPRRIAITLTALVGFLLVLGSGASAQTQNGLVNLFVSDVTVQLPVSVAANVCAIDVNVLAEDAADGDATCTALAESVAMHHDGGNGNAPDQEGLVNVIVTDLTIQAPISVAANVCDVEVNVLARDLADGDAVCNATGISAARSR